ncbi:MAG TPA: hypothetical protein VGY91_10345 [Chthoniobacterales bacterium]|jgi:hypothetical protein|nr:hypothetical protein [Chthoniobacterales bacterium]
MMLNRSTRRPGNCKLNRHLFGLLLLAALATAVAAETNHFFLILDPYFYRSPLVLPVDGTRETVFTFYRALDDATLTPAKPQELSDRERAAVKIQTESHARKLLEVIKPEIIRDTHGVITALRLYSSDPTISGILLLPEIGNHYANLLGPDCYLAVPNRRTVLFFPRLASDIQSFAPLVHSLYHNDPWPISTEIFEIANGKLRASGRFSEEF